MTDPGHTATEDGSMAHAAEPTAPTEPNAPARPAGGGSLRTVAVLAVGSFAMGTDSFVLAGILPNIAAGLHVSTAAGGQTITVFALTYALAAPLLAGITGALPRKPLMLAALVLFVLANLASAAAPSLGLLLAARVAGGLGAALYTPNASAAAAPWRWCWAGSPWAPCWVFRSAPPSASGSPGRPASSSSPSWAW